MRRPDLAARFRYTTKKWEDAYLKDVIDLDDFKAKRDALTARRNSLEQELARLDGQKRSLEEARIETASLMEYGERVRNNLSRFNIVEKR